MSAACAGAFLAPQTTCGRGSCEPLLLNGSTSRTHACVCEPGWSSVGDMALVPGAACNIHVDAVRGLWICVLATLIIPGWALLKTVRAFRTTNASPTVRNLGAPACNLVYLFCGAVLAVGKIIRPDDWWVGNDARATLLFFLTSAVVIIGAIFVATNIAEMALHQVAAVQRSRDTHERARRTKAALLVSVGLIELALLVSNFVLLAPQSALAFVAFFGAACAFTDVLVVPITITRLTNMLIRDVGLGISRLETNLPLSPQPEQTQQQLQVLKELLARFELVNINLRTRPIQGAIIGIMCCWPLPGSMMSYFYPIIWISAGPALAAGSVMTLPIAKVDNSNKRRKRRGANAAAAASPGVRLLMDIKAMCGIASGSSSGGRGQVGGGRVDALSSKVPSGGNHDTQQQRTRTGGTAFAGVSSNHFNNLGNLHSHFPTAPSNNPEDLPTLAEESVALHRAGSTIASTAVISLGVADAPGGSFVEFADSHEEEEEEATQTQRQVSLV